MMPARRPAGFSHVAATKVLAPTGIISVSPEPPYTPEAQAQAAHFFKEACASCHGPEGRGDGADASALAYRFFPEIWDVRTVL